MRPNPTPVGIPAPTWPPWGGYVVVITALIVIGFVWVLIRARQRSVQAPARLVAFACSNLSITTRMVRFTTDGQAAEDRQLAARFLTSFHIARQLR